MQNDVRHNLNPIVLGIIVNTMLNTSQSNSNLFFWKEVNQIYRVVVCLIFLIPVYAQAQKGSKTQLTEFVVKSGNLDLYGLKDATGKIVLPAKYRGIYWTNDGYATVDHATKYDQQGLIDSLGNLIIDPMRYCGFRFSKVGNNVATFDEKGLLRVSKCLPNKTAVTVYGCVDKTGKEIIAPKYNHIGSFNEGFAAVGMEDKSGKWLYGFIDISGKLIVPILYKEVAQFSEGLAAVKFTNGKFGYINAKGDVVIPATYSEANNFENGEAMVTAGSLEPYEQYLATYNHYIIDKKGKKKQFLIELIETVKSNNLSSVEKLLKKTGVSSFSKRTDVNTINGTAGIKELATIFKSSNIVDGCFQDFSIAQFKNGNLQFSYHIIPGDLALARIELTTAGYTLGQKNDKLDVYLNNAMIVLLPNEKSAVEMECHIYRVPGK